MKRTTAAFLCAALLLPLPAVAADDSDTGTWFDGLEPGMCFDDTFDAEGNFDFTVLAAVVPCDGPHGNEIVARVPLEAGDYPGDNIVDRVDEACAVEQAAFLGRPIDASLMSAFNVAPSAEDWSAGVRHGLCIVYASEPVSGTAAGGSLRAPGEIIAAYREVDGEADIWLIDAGSGELVRDVTQDVPNELIAPPSWTPDGSSIIFTEQAGQDGEQSDIYVVSVEDRTVEPLVVGPAKEDSGVVSPDGAILAYVSDENAPDLDVYARVLATGETNRLTSFADRDSTPRWAPDGTKLVFRRRTDGVSDIWTMNPDGSDQLRLTDNGASNYDPRWSPDGTKIAFTTNLRGNYDIAVMNADGSDPHLLTTHPANDEYPAWSSDGSFLAFQSSRQGGVSLWLMHADGSDQSELTGLSPVGFAAFAPSSPPPMFEPVDSPG